MPGRRVRRVASGVNVCAKYADPSTAVTSCEIRGSQIFNWCYEAPASSGLFCNKMLLFLDSVYWNFQVPHSYWPLTVALSQHPWGNYIYYVIIIMSCSNSSIASLPGTTSTTPSGTAGLSLATRTSLSLTSWMLSGYQAFTPIIQWFAAVRLLYSSSDSCCYWEYFVC